MLSLKNFGKIYLYRPFVDFRKGIGGLTSLIQEGMDLNPFENALFLFSSKARDRIKIVYWDKTGFVMWYKILEEEKFRWPAHLNDDYFVVDSKTLTHFLKGLNPWQKPHRELKYQKV